MGSTGQVRPVSLSDAVTTVMRWPVVTMDVDDPLVDVARRLTDQEIGAVVVLEKGRPVGIVSERDVTAAVAAEANPRELSARDVMTASPHTVPPEAPLYEAVRMMRESRVRHLPVVSQGVITGVLSMRDLFRVLETVAEAGGLGPGRPGEQVGVTWRHHQRALWLLTCPMCGREPEAQ
ncbi:MAG: CBS domain-containing protein [Nocardioides sp.]